MEVGVLCAKGKRAAAQSTPSTGTPVTWFHPIRMFRTLEKGAGANEVEKERRDVLKEGIFPLAFLYILQQHIDSPLHYVHTTDGTAEASRFTAGIHERLGTAHFLFARPSHGVH